MSLVQIGILLLEILATPAEVTAVLLVTVRVRALIRDEFPSASNHEILSSKHMTTRTVTRTLCQVTLTPLAHASHN